MDERVTVAAAQLAPAFMDREASVAQVCAALREAGAAGAKLVAFPETFVPGYPYWALVEPPLFLGRHLQRLYAQAVEVPSPATEAMCAAARDAGTFAVVGVNERNGGTLYNTQLFIGPDGRLLGRRRKLVPTSQERMVWGRGDGSDLPLFETPWGLLGGLICYEHSNALFRYALQGRGEALHVANWPGGLGFIDDVIDAAIRHYAFEGGAFVINATALLTDEIIAALGEGDAARKLRPGGGFSAIVGPRGNYLAGPEHTQAGLLYAELDLRERERAKAFVDTAGHYARPDVVRLLLQRAAPRVVEAPVVEEAEPVPGAAGPVVP